MKQKSTKAQRPSKEERKAALKNRTSSNVSNRESGGNWTRAVNFAGQEVEFYKPVKGSNLIDILPYTIKTKNHPQGMEIGYEDYILDIYVHQNVGPNDGQYLCLAKNFNKPCPICEEQADLRKQDDVSDEEIKALTPKRRAFYNVINLKNDDDKVLIWEVSHFLFEKELLEEAETAGDSVITFADLDDGASISFRATEEKMGKNTFFKYKKISFEDREPYDEDILDETYSLDEFLVVPTYEEVRNAFLGMETEADVEDDDDEEEEEKPSTNRKRKRRVVEEVDEEDEDDDEESPFIDDDDDDDDDDDEEEEEEEEKPAARKRVKRGESSKKKEVKNEKSKSKTKCPFDHEFGVDCDVTKDCLQCDLWDDCADEKEALNG